MRFSTSLQQNTFIEIDAAFPTLSTKVKNFNKKIFYKLECRVLYGIYIYEK